MRPTDVAELLLLAALWGASFLFMRVATPEFGPFALIALRVGIAAAFLILVLASTRKLHALGGHVGAIAFVGIINSAIPFVLFSYATLSLTAGFTAILNGTAPLWGALVALVWLGKRLRALQVVGLALGFGGVVVLGWEHASFRPGGSGLAILAVLGATLSYGIAANFTRERLGNVDPIVVAAGSQVGAVLALVPFAIVFWPDAPISDAAWASVIALGIACTGIAYYLYFRLIANLGATRAIAVTYLIPVFGVLWGALFLGETITGQMLAGGAIVLVGTALATGAVRRVRSERL